MIVVDASVLVELVIKRASSSVAARLHVSADWHAPVTVDAEVLHALRRRWVAGLMTDLTMRSSDFSN